MSAAEQREAFQAALTQTLEDSCTLEVVQAIHEQLAQRIEQHKESKDPEPLIITANDVGAILSDCGIEESQVAAFRESCNQQFGEDAALSPANLIDTKRFEVKTSDATISLALEQSYQVETRTIDGKRYILIPAGEGLEVNGLSVDWTT